MNKSIVLKSAAIAGGSLVSLAAQASVVYTDLTPDVYLYNTSYDIDVNIDGIADFNLTQSISYSGSNTYSYLDFTSYGSNSATISSPLDAGTLIDGGLGFSDAGRLASYESIYTGSSCSKYGCYSTYSTNLSGDWNGIFGKYIGLELVVDGSTYYGWADIDVYTSAVGYLRAHAYEDWAGEGIYAGATSNPATELQVEVPEPSSLLLLAAGVAGLGVSRRKRSRSEV